MVWKHDELSNPYANNGIRPGWRDLYLTLALSLDHGLPVVDGVSVAIGLIKMLARNGLRTSKRGGYAVPLPKSYSGIFARDQPS